MDAEAIARKARKSLGEFCRSECSSYCCRKGYLTMNSRQADTVCGKKRALLLEQGLLKKLGEDSFTLYMGRPEQPCPSLMEDFTCRIHSSINRPKACGEFPIFVDEKEKTVKMSTRCPAVKGGMLYAFEARLIARGYKIVQNHPYGELDLGNIDMKKDDPSCIAKMET